MYKPNSVCLEQKSEALRMARVMQCKTKTVREIEMVVRIDRVVTRGGDTGQTSLGDGSRVSKHVVRIEAMGVLDELNAAIGLLRTQIQAETKVSADLMKLQNLLFDLGADVCHPETAKNAQAKRISEKSVSWLEEEIANMLEEQTPLASFVLPGGSAAAAWAHMVRTQTRSVERRFVALAQDEDVNPVILKILNRMSDYFFVLARQFNNNGKTDVLWKPSWVL